MSIIFTAQNLKPHGAIFSTSFWQKHAFDLDCPESDICLLSRKTKSQQNTKVEQPMFLEISISNYCLAVWILLIITLYLSSIVCKVQQKTKASLYIRSPLLNTVTKRVQPWTYLLFCKQAQLSRNWKILYHTLTYK